HWLAMRFRRAGGFGRLLRRVGVGQRNRRAVRSKPSHDRRANAPRAPKNKRDLVGQRRFIMHMLSPLLTNKSKIVRANARGTSTTDFSNLRSQRRPCRAGIEEKLLLLPRPGVRTLLFPRSARHARSRRWHRFRLPLARVVAARSEPCAA